LGPKGLLKNLPLTKPHLKKTPQLPAHHAQWKISCSKRFFTPTEISTMFAGRAFARTVKPTSASSCLRTKFSRTLATKSIRERVSELIPEKQAAMKDLKAKHGNKEIGTCTVDQLIGGMRGVKSMLWETSLLDAEEGIRFRGLTIPECQAQLPNWQDLQNPDGPKQNGEPLPESLLWLLLTGEVPTNAEVPNAFSFSISLFAHQLLLLTPK
jgi:hypothetical protein